MDNNQLKQGSLDQPNFVVYLRFPFPRNGFQDPESCEWSEEKAQELRDYLSAVTLKNGEIEWTSLANRFKVSEPFILQQAIWLYEKELEYVRGQMIKMNRNIQVTKSQEKVKTTFKSSFPSADLSRESTESRESTGSQSYKQASIFGQRNSSHHFQPWASSSGSRQDHDSSAFSSQSSKQRTLRTGQGGLSVNTTPRLTGLEEDGTQSPRSYSNHQRFKQSHPQRQTTQSPHSPLQRRHDTSTQNDEHHFHMTLSQISSGQSANKSTSEDNYDQEVESPTSPAPRLLSMSRMFGRAGTSNTRPQRKDTSQPQSIKFGGRLNSKDTQMNTNRGRRSNVAYSDSEDEDDTVRQPSSKKTNDTHSLSKIARRSSRLNPYDDESDPDDESSTSFSGYQKYSNYDTLQARPSQTSADNEDDEDFDAFLTSDDLRLNLNNSSKVTVLDDDSDIYESPSNSQDGTSRTNKILRNDNTDEDSGGSNKTKPVTSSMSSFSDLSDTSVSKSALEEAFATKMKFR